MRCIRSLITKAFVILSLALGGMPRVVALLDLLQAPSVARVAITNRRRPEYDELFTGADRDERHVPARGERPDLTYLRVDAA
jgi:hypothetical protein